MREKSHENEEMEEGKEVQTESFEAPLKISVSLQVKNLDLS